ncbi:hypothetical protein BGX34_006495 [Mortierella sp. NVP85]|nr:hypothetical protein BGX34_006495 [Mortierella sp. NVP85]
MEEETQLFRLAGKTAVEKIPFDYVDGNSVIYWEDIEQVFPGVKHVKHKDVAVKLLRDSNRNRVVPYCIKHHPGVVLDVVLSSSDEDTLAVAGRNGASGGENVVESLLPKDTSSGDDRHLTASRAYTLPSASALSELKREPKATLSLEQIAEIAQKTSMESEIEQRLVSSLPSDIQVQVRASSNLRESLIQVIQDGQVHQPNEQLIACLQKLDDKMMENNELAHRIMDLVSENKELLVRLNDLQKTLDSKQDEMKQLQVQALDRLAQLQNSVKALLTQTYELHEYPIPRLFIVLPVDSSSWNPLELFKNKFRLYFLCECGEHTKFTNSKIPHHIHLAKHEGYDIDRPNEFFQQYGTYVLTILRMLKYGISVAGIAVPTLPHLIRVDALDQATESLKSLTNTIEPGMDQVIKHIEKASADKGGMVVGYAEQMEDNEALEGADLRQLESFLKNQDESRVHGNLYRTVTAEGHVKWVCIDHYRENYHEKATKTFRNTVEALKGSFDENTGRVEVALLSKVQAEQFYVALEKARSVYELKVELDWEATQSDFKKLRNTLAITNIGVLELHLNQQDGPTRDILNRGQRYDPILDIMGHRSIQSFTIGGIQDFVKRSSIQSRNDGFSNLRYLEICLNQSKDEISGIKCLVARASNLSSLALRTDFGDVQEVLESENGYLVQVYNAIAEHQTYPVVFKEWNIRIPPLPTEANRPINAHQCREHLFQAYCESTSEVILDGVTLGSSALDTLDKTAELGPRFQKLELRRADPLGNKFIRKLFSVVARSELSSIILFTKEDEQRMHILESIQWKHLRNLNILPKAGTFETSVMSALVESVKKTSGKLDLVGFELVADNPSWIEDDPLSMPQGDLLQSFIALTSLESLYLEVVMTLGQILALLRLADLSRLKILVLWTDDFDPDSVDAILDSLQNATKLKNLKLVGASITEEQKERMNAKGVSLKRSWL